MRLKELYESIAKNTGVIDVCDGLSIEIGKTSRVGSYRQYSQTIHIATVFIDDIEHKRFESTNKKEMALKVCQYLARQLEYESESLSELEDFLDGKKKTLEEKKELENKKKADSIAEMDAYQNRLKEEDIFAYEMAKSMLGYGLPEKYAYDSDGCRFKVPKKLLGELGLSREYVCHEDVEFATHHLMYVPVSKKYDFTSGASSVWSMLRARIDQIEHDVENDIRQKFGKSVRAIVDRAKFRLCNYELPNLWLHTYEPGFVPGVNDVPLADCYVLVWRDLKDWTRVEYDDFGPSVIVLPPVSVELLKSYVKRHGRDGILDIDSFEEEWKKGTFELLKMDEFNKKYGT